MIPYNDEEMVYSEKLKKYVLTPTGVTRNLFLDENMLSDFNNMSNANLFLEEVTEDIYRYMLSHCFVHDRKLFKHIIHTGEDYREPIKRALLYQVRYALRSASIALKDMHGVDIERSRLITLDKLRGDVGISHSSKEELMTAGMLSTRELLVSNIDTSNGWY